MLMIQETADEGLTFGEMLRDIPHDAGAIVVYVLMLSVVGFIWYGSRSKAAPPGPEARNDEGN